GARFGRDQANGAIDGVGDGGGDHALRIAQALDPAAPTGGDQRQQDQQGDGDRQGAAPGGLLVVGHGQNNTSADRTDRRSPGLRRAADHDDMSFSSVAFHSSMFSR